MKCVIDFFSAVILWIHLFPLFTYTFFFALHFLLVHCALVVVILCSSYSLFSSLFCIFVLKSIQKYLISSTTQYELLYIYLFFLYLAFHSMFIHCVWICVWISVNNLCDFYFQVVPQLHQPTMLIYWLLICSQQWYNNMKISLRLMRQKLSLKNSNRTNPMKFCLRLM